MRGILLAAVLVLLGSGMASAADCPGNPHALGVSRELVVSAADYPRLGRMQYLQSLPLADREVVLTFDDGPLPPYSDRALNILKADCVKATFFLVGRHARANPEAVRRIYNAGHTVGTHSQNHPLHQMSELRAEREIDGGIASVVAALGDARALAPYFRIPGLLRTSNIEALAKMRSLVVWSSDTLADDWLKISAGQVLRLALLRLERQGKGVLLLLHDIQPRTVLMLPTLLVELKRRGFKIVHVVPEGERPTLPEMPIMTSAAKQGWPRVIEPAPRATTGSSGASSASAASEAQTVPLPPVRPVRHAAVKPQAKPRPMIAVLDLHAAQ